MEGTNINPKNNWKVAAICLIVVSVAFIGLSAYLGIKLNQTNSETLTKATSGECKCDENKEKTGTKTTSNNETAATTNKTAYFTIPEWDLSFKLPDGLSASDVSYYRNGSASIVLSTKRVENLGGVCKMMSGSDGSRKEWLVRLLRVYPDDSTYEIPGGFAKIADDVDGSAYYYEATNTYCSNDALVGRDIELLSKMLVNIKD